MREITVNSLALQLLPQKAVFIPAYKILVISDWHLGKIAHFRKEGIFLPKADPQDDFNELTQLLLQHSPSKVIFLGDLFHSQWNQDWEDFSSYIRQFPTIEFILTEGNHDILDAETWQRSGIRRVDFYALTEQRVILSHQPIGNLPPDYINLVGHIHPGCVLQGKGRQRFRLPCFHWKGQVFTLPAFGRWTGLYMLPREEDAKFYAIVHDAVILLPSGTN
ncbi:ligase-associated DNA damage response endonuclease PdeM [Sphingobacteriaceae bacterium WQ 2009]|uniref:Ligase-associated DNA damage response endonuclease PdeM n=1 Tax=Rhinopithecimicrobium faecis TaxID=2820698 RepID=A0A8T4HCS0_9SPHI|nr:ligase-associated DNA damage response endonuclease PdeM [Sphingobacteriaceae bacterium WQ 2009]